MSNDETSAIRQVIRAREAALSAGRSEAVIKPLATDVVVYDLQPPLRYSGAAARDPSGVEEWLKTWRAPPKVELTDPVIRVDGDLATAYGLSHLTGTKSDGTDVELWSRSTLVLTRSAAGWEIVHEHNSTPFKMDGSERAALDLKPE